MINHHHRHHWLIFNSEWLFINNSTNTVFENELPIHVELEQYLRSVALDNLFSNLDTYTESARNYYLYHNLTSNKWEWIKWDANETFGTYGGQTVSNMTTMAIDFHSNNRPLLERIFDSSIIFDQYRGQICYLIENFFIPTYLNPKIDALKSLIQSVQLKNHWVNKGLKNLVECC